MCLSNPITNKSTSSVISYVGRQGKFIPITLSDQCLLPSWISGACSLLAWSSRATQSFSCDRCSCKSVVFWRNVSQCSSCLLISTACSVRATISLSCCATSESACIFVNMVIVIWTSVVESLSNVVLSSVLVTDHCLLAIRIHGVRRSS